jgi:hypothetical protein
VGSHWRSFQPARVVWLTTWALNYCLPALESHGFIEVLTDQHFPVLKT